MQNILLAATLIGGAGLIIGIILVVFSKIMAVPVNQAEQDIRELLPGANCGACGYTSCDGYANVLASGEESSVALCKPGGNSTVEKLANYLGTDATEITPTTAVVMCQGDNSKTKKRANYQGVKTCNMANLVAGGDGVCSFGCLGYGDCFEVCQYDAITIEDGLAKIDPYKCTSCMMCIEICPKGIIELLPQHKASSLVLCHNEDPIKIANKACKVSCISCRQCVRACPEDCIEIKDNRAIIDYELCTNCGECQKVCPHDCILSLYPLVESSV